MTNVLSTYNFGAGPSCLPKDVLEQIKADIPDWHQGVSVMEIGHRSNPFMDLMQRAQVRLRTLLQIPDDFSVLFMHGGARTQFSAIGLNLFYQLPVVDYLVTGHWSEEACKEAEKYTHVHVISDNGARNCTDLPEPDQLQTTPESTYLYYTDNETIQGLEFSSSPQVNSLLVCDMTSNILTRPIDWSRYGMVYASAQKNLGISGVTVVIVKSALLGQANPLTPSVMNYEVVAKSQSLYNTCPTFSIYVLDLMLAWVEKMGGVAYFSEKAEKVSNAFYNFIDNSSVYKNVVNPNARSRMNIPFSLLTQEMEAAFLTQASKQGLLALAGHRAVGGCRASFYNAMPEAGVMALIAFMKQFEKEQSFKK